MITLSLVDRELRVRARQPATVWARVAVAALASLTTLLWLGQAAAITPAETGRTVFGLLTWLGFGLCLFEGARHTADSLSREKRDGTLGLLFLTSMRSVDLVLGKLAAALLQTAYGLLAVVPVLAIPFATGGVTAGEFWRSQLALGTTLLLAGAVGLWVSARSEDLFRALLGVLGLLAALVVLPLLAELTPTPLSLPSPSPGVGLWLAGDAAYRVAPHRYWATQLLLVLMGLAFLTLASVRATRLREVDVPVAPWPRRRHPRVPATGSWGYRIPSRLHARRPARDRPDPGGAGLVAQRRGATAMIWAALLLPTAFLLGIQLATRFLGGSAIGVFSLLHSGLKFVTVALLAMVAARPLLEARQSGGLELLLCTPLPSQHVAWAHWEDLWRRVRPPFLLYALGPATLYVLIGLTRPGGGGPSWMLSYLVQSQLPATFVQVAAVVATCWVGLWFGVSGRSLGHAVGWTLVLVVLLPWILSTITFALIIRLLSGGTSLVLGGFPWLLLSPSLLVLAWLVGLSVWARRRLLRDFRAAAAGTLETTRGWGFLRKNPSPPRAVSA